MSSALSEKEQKELGMPFPDQYLGVNGKNADKNNVSSSIENLEDGYSPDASKIESVVEEPDFSDIDQKKLIRKLDFRLMPLFTVLYLISFLDRGNIGAAKIEGLAEDLHLKGNEYNICLTVFFIFYATFEIPSNTILKHVKPSLFLVIAIILWGIAMTLSGLSQKYADLLACRALLGLFEAPLFPGISFYLSVYYTKNEFLVREAIFFSAASIAGAFSGLLAAAITQMDGLGGLAGWRYIFILEGCLTVLLGVLSYFVFPDFPQDAKFLNDREREFVTYRVKHDSNTDGQSLKKLSGISHGQRTAPLGEDHSNNPKYFWAVFKDWQSWTMLLVYCGTCVPLYGISLFTPTLIKTMGYASTKAQLLSAPIYIVAAIYCVVQALIMSKLGLRSPFILFNFLCMLAGYIVCISMDPEKYPHSVYGALFVVALGVYPSLPSVVVWFSNNVSGTYKRAVAIGFQIGIGNFSGAYSSNIYRGKDSPRYLLGHGMEIMFISLGLVAMLINVIGYSISNSMKKRRLESGYYDEYTDQELIEMGDKSPYFIYRL
ncbi:MFS general substrate transporter [Hyphopichia burtonii NRRL Y-1933]|uniref:MFS general substrate transporter n=1 Tax=Hyphopichia burtonii NRRL Y-1933 TaxID=984485 RepID=A0A1E4RD07_9ASCO|nr:MFS general substrate transporter [Hyphopichia burtonii NRRL Y-1933]ODV65149.1 MFS general substrate transporter [Hyphopichia burtonii NRRL Y-1933]